MIICGNGYLKQQNIRNSTKSTIFPQIRAFVLEIRHFLPFHPPFILHASTVHPPRIVRSSSLYLACIQLVSSLFASTMEARYKPDALQMLYSQTRRKKSGFAKKIHFFQANICVIQKKALPLSSFSQEGALSARKTHVITVINKAQSTTT